MHNAAVAAAIALAVLIGGLIGLYIGAHRRGLPLNAPTPEAQKQRLEEINSKMRAPVNIGLVFASVLFLIALIVALST